MEPFDSDLHFKKINDKYQKIVSNEKNNINIIKKAHHLIPCGTGFHRVSLDETKKPACVSAQPSDKTLNDYSFSNTKAIWDTSSSFFCTFTYSTTACFSKKLLDTRTCIYHPEFFNPINPEDVIYINGQIIMPLSWYKDEVQPCNCIRPDIYKLTPFCDMSFDDQYTLFRKHFTKWLNSMNRIMDSYAKISGYEVFIEKTEKGILHAHSKIYSKCTYKEGFGQNSSAIWANIAHGKVSAMKHAFEPIRNLSGLNKYLIKSQNDKIL